MSSGELINDKDSAAPKPSDSSAKWRDELGSVHLRQTATEIASSIVAGTSGAVAFGVLKASGPWGKALSVPVAMLAGGVTKYGSKDGLQHVVLDKDDRTVSAADFAWGAVDGVAGVTASIADQRASLAFTRAIGKSEFGAKISESTAQLVGRQLIEGSAFKAIGHNTVRGLAGGAAGSLTWSLPHETVTNWDQLTKDPITGLTNTAKGIAFDTTVGTLTGGVLGGAATAVWRSPEIVGRTAAGIRGDAKYLKMDEFVINDFHSNIDRLPQLKTKLDERTAASAAKGVPSEFNVAGDALSGHVNFAFTQGGKVENEALARMGLKNLIPGNHEYDAAGGRFVPERYPTVIGPVLKNNPELSLLNANLDLSAYPEYAALTKPYVVHEIPGPRGPEKVATVGLITEEGAVNKIGYRDAAQTAVETVRELNGMGIKNIKLLTHLGLDEDKKLAQTLLDNGLHVAKISGGHTHDVVASPIWVSNKRTLADHLQFWKPTKEIPITQAGSGGNYLAENHIVFNADGSANRWLSRGVMHPMTGVKPDTELQGFIASQTAEIGALKSTEYNATTVAKYSLANARNRETAIGNLIADATLDGLQKRMGSEAPQIAMVHSGGIRSEIPADVPLTRQEIANVFMNAGTREGEQKELVRITMSGDEVRKALEYGVRDFPSATPRSATSRFQQIFGSASSSKFDEPGNFVQTTGLKYTYDLTQAPWKRVTEVQVKTADGKFEPIDAIGKYTVVTRFHPVDKWAKAGMFGEGVPLETVYANLNAKPVPVSQVDLLGEYIQGKKLDPNVDSRVEGRITNATPVAQEISVRPARSIAGFATLDGQNHEAKSERR